MPLRSQPPALPACLGPTSARNGTSVSDRVPALPPAHVGDLVQVTPPSAPQFPHLEDEDRKAPVSGSHAHVSILTQITQKRSSRINLVQPLRRKIWQSFVKLRINTSHDPEIQLLGIDPRERKARVHRKPCARMSIMDSPATVQNREKPGFQQLGASLNKLRYSKKWNSPQQ